MEKDFDITGKIALSSFLEKYENELGKETILKVNDETDFTNRLSVINKPLRKEYNMPLNTDNLHRCISTLESALKLLSQHDPDSIEYEIYRNAVVKGFELTLETSGKLLRKALRPYFATSKQADRLVFKDIFRSASKHGIITVEEVSRWFVYRDNRNNTAHDYGVGFAEETLKLMPQFILDAKHLKKELDSEFAEAE